MELEKINIRPATKEDIEKIAIIKVDGWKNTYQDIIDLNYLNKMSYEEQTNKYSSSYDLNTIFVAELNNEVIAFCRVCDYGQNTYQDADCEIREIYVKSEYKHMGVGSKIFSYVLNYFRSNNKQKLYLGVFEKNDSARKFYEKMGGIANKKSYLEINGVKYPTISYIFKLT